MLQQLIFSGLSERVECGNGIDCSSICDEYFKQSKACLKIVLENTTSSSNTICTSSKNNGGCGVEGFHPPGIPNLTFLKLGTQGSNSNSLCSFEKNEEGLGILTYYILISGETKLSILVANIQLIKSMAK